MDSDSLSRLVLLGDAEHGPLRRAQLSIGHMRRFLLIPTRALALGCLAVLNAGLLRLVVRAVRGAGKLMVPAAVAAPCPAATAGLRGRRPWLGFVLLSGGVVQLPTQHGG